MSDTDVSPAVSQTAAGDSDAVPLGAADTLTMLVATDLHLGFAEKDPVRGLDSFLAFEEVLALARTRGADLVLLAGDIFHENRPSRLTLFKTMQILRRYVLGYNPVRVQILSDQATHFGDRKQGGPALFNRVNWEDPNYNVVRERNVRRQATEALYSFYRERRE